MRALAVVLVLMVGTPSRAATWRLLPPPQQQPSIELIPGGAELTRTWWSEHVWGLWGGLVLMQGIALFVPAGAFLHAADDNLALARAFPRSGVEERAYDQARIGAVFGGFAITAILTAAFMFVYQARGTWHEDAYWQSR